MTRDEIYSKPAGPDLDALVATDVMGWQMPADPDMWPAWMRKDGDRLVWAYYWPTPPTDEQVWAIGLIGDRVFNPSTDITAAWEVLKKLVENGMCPALLFGDNGKWALSFGTMANIDMDDDDFTVVHEFVFTDKREWAETAPLAICRAALIATLHGCEE